MIISGHFWGAVNQMFTRHCSSQRQTCKNGFVLFILKCTWYISLSFFKNITPFLKGSRVKNVVTLNTLNNVSLFFFCQYAVNRRGWGIPRERWNIYLAKPNTCLADLMLFRGWMCHLMFVAHSKLSSWFCAFKSQTVEDVFSKCVYIHVLNLQMLWCSGALYESQDANLNCSFSSFGRSSYSISDVRVWKYLHSMQSI